MKYFYLILTTFFLISCGGGSDTSINSNPNSISSNKDINKTPYSTIDKKILISQDKQIEYLKNIKKAIIEIDLPLNESKSIYTITTSHFNNQSIKISSPSMRLNSFRLENSDLNMSKKVYFPFNVLKFRENLPKKIKNRDSLNKRLTLSKRDYIEDEEESFYVETFDNYGGEFTKIINATAKKVILNVATKYGYKNLVVWVSNEDLENGVITQDMIDELANIFLEEGDNNDIYDWVTNIYGPEWGDDAKNYGDNLITNENTIHILIYDMNINNMAGFFYARDNYLKSSEPYSNEKIMFYINSRMYGKDDEDSKKETFTTLAHEFQHMINFYQRWVKKDIQDETWFNEMLSETTEDLLATKIGYKGPRNVDPNDGSAGAYGNRGGRYPYFNKYNYIPVTSWYNDIDDYGRASAFGTFLVRNYGGAKFLNNLYKLDKTGKDAIVEATNENNFNDILNKWGAGVMLSDKISLYEGMPQYNFGDFKETTLNNITYKMGSINFFNYIPNPTYQNNTTADKDANIYTKIGNNLNGKVYIDIDIEKGGDLTIVVK